MFRTFYADRTFIENKYHKVDEPFDPLKRRAYHGYDFDETTGMTDDEILAGLDALALENKDLPHPVAKAKAVEYVLQHTRIDVNEHDYFIGIYSQNRLITKSTRKTWNDDVFQNKLPEVKARMKDFNAAGAIAVWPDFDHAVPDWKSIMTLGFRGIRQRARDYRQKLEATRTLTPQEAAFYDGIEIEYSAILDFVERVRQYALTKTHAKAKVIADSLAQLHKGAPTNTYEALQLMYIYFIISDNVDTFQVRSLGNGLDATLYPFYEKDLENKTFTREEIKEFLAYFMLQWSAIGNYWGQPLYLAGTNYDGTTRVNDLSYAIVETYDEIEIYNPKIQIKVNHNTPKEFIYRIFDMIRRGNSSFVFCCEPGIMKAVMSYGATEEEAHDIDIRGCYETGVRANEVSTFAGYVNALKAVEYVFSNGYDKRIEKQIGLKTGEVENIKSFEQFYDAVLKQWAYLIDSSIDMANQFEQYFEEINPSSIYSGTMENSLEKAVDAYQHGMKYNNSALLNCAFASLVDAVMSVKEFVYDKGVVTLPQLKEILDNNWEGNECLRKTVLKSNRKYGNDDEETDRYATELATFFAKNVNNRPNSRGGVYKVSLHSAKQYVIQGEKTLASPDGRKAGEEVAKNASPSVGVDRNGVTALVKSCLRIKPYQAPESFCLDVMLHPSAIAGDDGLDVLYTILKIYLENDGMSIQFNVMNSEILRDAQKNPEQYRNLQVRVCGWNVLWNNLSLAEQEAYILRAENIQ